MFAPRCCLYGRFWCKQYNAITILISFYYFLWLSPRVRRLIGCMDSVGRMRSSLAFLLFPSLFGCGTGILPGRLNLLPLGCSRLFPPFSVSFPLFLGRFAYYLSLFRLFLLVFRFYSVSFALILLVFSGFSFSFLLFLWALLL